jgi:predicted RNase H-like nuclease (RuvC/YqgF family)
VATGFILVIGIVVLCTLLPEDSFAEAKKPDASAQALRKAQGMLRDLTATVTSLQAEKTALQEQVDKLNVRVKELEGLQDQVRQQKSALDSLHSNNEQLQGRLSSEARRFESLSGKLRETQQELGRYRQDNALLVQAVNERSQWIKACSDKNAQMLGANKELLKKYQDKGLWTVLKDEPFTGFASVAEENAAQDFRFKLEDLKVTPWREPESQSRGRPEQEPSPAEEADAEDDGE